MKILKVLNNIAKFICNIFVILFTNSRYEMCPKCWRIKEEEYKMCWKCWENK